VVSGALVFRATIERAIKPERLITSRQFSPQPRS
jgi:hypothetical protein